MKYLCICWVASNGKIYINVHDAAVVSEHYELAAHEFFTDVKPNVDNVSVSDFTE